MAEREFLPPTSSLVEAAADPRFLIEQDPILADTATHPWYVALHLAMTSQTEFLPSATMMQEMNRLQGAEPATGFGYAIGRSAKLAHRLMDNPLGVQHWEIASVQHPQALPSTPVPVTGYRLSADARKATPLVTAIAASYIAEGPLQRVLRQRDLGSHEGPYGSHQTRRLRGLLALLTEGPLTARSLGNRMGTDDSTARQTMHPLQINSIVELGERQRLPGGPKPYVVAERWQLPIKGLLRRLHSIHTDSDFQAETTQALEELTSPGPLFRQLIVRGNGKLI